MRKRVQSSVTPPPKPSSPDTYKAAHKDHGRGPYYEVMIGQWHIWRCPCGEKYHFSEEARKLFPNDFILDRTF